MRTSTTMRKYMLLCCGAAVSVTAVAAVIKGEITDSDGLGLPGVAVQLVSLNDSTRKGYTSTDENGRFELTDVAPAKYDLRLAMTGMEDISRGVEVTDSAETKNLGRIEMNESPEMLKETVVTAVRAAVVAKQDTLEFNAGSFHTSPNASVEDLLKKLPGVEVASDGTITSGGKSVTKILVDGKEFFADDPKAATKNLPSDMVEKVQVVDRKSEIARLTGVDDGEDETVINLTVKKNMNNGWFGSVEGGYGTDSRYYGKFNLNYFNNGNQFSIIGGGNNINEMGFSDKGRGRFRDFGGNNGINSTQQLGINFNVGNEEKFRVGGNIFYTHSDRNARSRFETQYLFPDSISRKIGGNQTRDMGHSIRAQFRLNWNISEADVIDFRPEFSLNLRRSELRDSANLYSGYGFDNMVNRNYSMRFNRGTDWNASGRLIYTHKFLSHPGRSISAQFNYSYSDTRQKSTSWNDIEYFASQQDSERLFEYIDSRQWNNYLEGRVTWTEPLGDVSNGNFLEAAYKASVRFNNADKLTYDIPWEDYDPAIFGLPKFSDVPDGAIFDSDLSNRFRNKYTSQELQLGYKKVATKYNLNAGITFSPSSSGSEDLINADRNIDTRWVFNVAPYLRFRYKFSKNSSLMVNYRARTSQPSLTQLQPVADVSDPLNIVIGNPNLKPTFSQSLGFHFNDYDPESQRSIFAVANASFSLNNIIARTISDPTTGVRTTTYANSNGNWNVFGMAMVNQPFRNRQWRFTGRLNVRYNNNAGYINGDFNRSGNLNLSPTAGVTFSCDIFQMTVSPAYTFQMSTSSLAMQANRYTHAYGFNADASLYLPFGLELSTDLDFSKATGYSQGFDNTQWLWNAKLSYSVLKDKSLTFSVRAYDLLGQKKNVTRSVSAAMISDNEYNDLSRYVMFGVSWKFNTVQKKSNRNAEENFPMMPPPDENHRGGNGERPQGPPPGGFRPGGPGGF